MKKLIFLFTFITMLLFLLQKYETISHNQNKTLPEKYTINKEISDRIVNKINKKNSRISNISCNLNVLAQISDKRPARLHGNLFYEKEKKFRLILYSFLGKELDIGSDGYKFWFWSKRMNPSALYWATYDNFHKTRLKTPFNPLWLSTCLGIEQIDYNIYFDENNRWYTTTKTLDSKGKPIIITTYVNQNDLLITGHGIYDRNKLIASTEIESFVDNVPKKMSFLWYEENASMVWNLYNMKTNTNIDPESLTMPNITPKIDMSTD